MAESLRDKSVRGVTWSAIERFSLIGVQFVIQIVLARLLTPTDYGIVGMIAVFLAISQTFIDCGFTNALIQNQQRTERDFATAFFFNAFISVFFYALLFIGAPWIADFYEMPELVSVTRVIGLSLILSALSAVHRTKLTIVVDFKRIAYASLSAVILSGVVGIAMAYKGFGVWALVAQTLVNRGANTLLLWLIIRWHPQHFFSLASFKPMFSYGSKLLGAGLIHTISMNLYSLVIGKFFSAASLGFYSRANQMAGFPASTGSGILSRVTFPLLATVQNDDARLSNVYRKYLRLSTGAIAPAMLGLCALAEPIIVALIGEKWLPAVPLMQILCLAWMSEPITSVNLNLLYVKGRSDLVLRLEVIKKTLTLLLLLVGLYFGVVGICVGRVLSFQGSIVVNTYCTGKILKMTYWQQMREVLPIYLLAAVAGGAAFASTIPLENPWIKICVGVPVGALIYIVGARIFHFDIWDEAVAMLVKVKDRLLPP